MSGSGVTHPPLPALRHNPPRIGRIAIHLLALVICTGRSGVADAADNGAAPWLPYRDANPFIAASGLPFTAPSVAPDRWRVEVIASASNTELAFDRVNEHLVYDAEVHEVRVFVTRALGEHWIARATVGGMSFGNGFLDSFLEDYHRTFGFSNGDRGHLDTDGHAISYTDGAGSAVLLDRSLHAVTPALLDLVYRAPANGHEWLYGATLKLPVSHASPLVDDRAVDISGWIAVQSTDPASRAPWGARVGVMQRGNSRLLPERVKETVPFADATVAYVLLPGWDVAAQLQWHAALYDSDIPFLESAATLAVSSAWHARDGWTLRAGLVEDAIPRHAQDVTFFIGLSL